MCDFKLMIKTLKPEYRHIHPAQDLTPMELRDIIFTLRYGATIPQSKEYILNSTYNISRLLRIKVSEVTDILSLAESRDFDVSTLIKQKPPRLDECQIDEVTNPASLR